MNALVTFLAAHGLMLLVGASALLAAGAGAAALQRSPIHRQRLGEMTIAATLAWLAIACLPLPRWPANKAPTEAAPANASTAIELSAEELALLRQISEPKSNSSTRAPRIVRDGPGPAKKGFRKHAAAEQVAAPTSRIKTIERSTGDAGRLPLGIWLARVYLCGVGACAAWLLLGQILLVRMIGRAGPPAPWLAESFASVAREYGVRRARLRVCPRAIRPLSCGLLRPTVLLGADLTESGNAGRLRQVLRHELAHLAQRDAWGNALFNLAFPPLYLHPLYWWLRSRTFLARELIADDRAAAATGRVTYAADLLSLAKASRAPARGPLGAVAMFHLTTDLYRRILMLVQRQDALQNRCSRPWRAGWLAASAAVFALACGTLGLRPAAAQDSKSQADDGLQATDTRTVDVAADVTVNKPDTATEDRQIATSNLADTGDRQVVTSEELANNKPLDVGSKDAGPSREALEKKLKDTEDQAKRLREMLGALGYDTREPRSTNEADLKKAYDEIVTSADTRDGRLERLTKKYQNGNVMLGLAEKTSALTDGDNAPALMNMAKAGAANPDLVGSNSIRPGLDLVNFANSYADATGNISVARARVQFSEGHDRIVAEAQVHNAEAKARLLGNIIKVALTQAEADLARTRTLAGQGAISHSEMQEAEGRVQILRLILQSGQESGGANHNKGQQLGNGSGQTSNEAAP